MTTVPAGQDPFVVSVQVEFAIEKLVYAHDLAEAQDIADQEAAGLAEQLAARTGIDVDSPWATVEHGARIPAYNEVFQSVDPEQYPPLEPYFPTLVRDPYAWPDEEEAPDYPDFGDKAA